MTAPITTLLHLTLVQFVGLGLVATVTYACYRVVHELYFSPLAKFPGPKLAAVTKAYEVYYDVILGGQYTFKIRDLHAQYGPIMRISPVELHVSDPAFLEVLYAGPSGGARDKLADHVQGFGMDSCAFSTIDHRLHRLRRSVLNPFFSKQRINNLQSLIWQLADKLCARLEEQRAQGSVVPMRFAFSSLTTDAITSYSFNKSWCLLDSEDYNSKLFEAIQLSGSYQYVTRFTPWLYSIVQAIPPRFLKKVSIGLGAIVEDIHLPLVRAISEVMNEKYLSPSVEAGPPTIFHQLLTCDLPPSEKTYTRIMHEAKVLIVAGADSTSNTLTVATFHLLDQPQTLAKLRAELRTIMPGPTSQPPLQQLQDLPYLTAVINEALRLSYGASSRLGRSAPDQVMKCGDWEIPPGTAVGMTSVIGHHDESIFPDSHSFIPERWIKAAEVGKPLDRYLMSFNRGTRICLGMQLAKAELYIVLAAVFRRFDMELFHTTKRDVEVARDFKIPYPPADSKGVRVLVSDVQN